MKENQLLSLKKEKYRKDSLTNNSIIEIGKIKLIKFKRFEEIKGLVHCFTTRTGGVSTGCCDSLNLSFGREKNVENVRENYRRLMEAYGEKDTAASFTNQNHSREVKRISSPDSEYYGPWVFDGEEIDGMVTKEKDITLFTYYGDCVPVYLYDREKKTIGLVHSGWRGTVINAGGAGVEKMKAEFGTKPENIIAVIGPSIGPECFQVDRDVAVEFENKYGENSDVVYKDKIEGKFLVDLWEANRKNLMEYGVLEENIIVSGLCTCCQENLFFSHRRDKGKTGSMAALMTLK